MELCSLVRDRNSLEYVYFILATSSERERLAHHMGVLEQIGVEAEASARIDPLTSLGNRRKMDEALEGLIARRDRYKETFCVALMDIDHFKTISDTAGHPAGDEALRRMARIVWEQLRQSDKAYRYGGEELLVAVPSDIRRAATAADRVRRAVEAAGIPHPGRPGPEHVLTLSVGVASAEGDPTDFLGAADDALYRAK